MQHSFIAVQPSPNKLLHVPASVSPHLFIYGLFFSPDWFPEWLVLIKLVKIRKITFLI